MSEPVSDSVSLLAEWEALNAVSPGDRLFRSRRLSQPTRIDLRVGVRETDGAPCLIALPGGAPDRLVTFETSGLRARPGSMDSR